MAKTTFTARDIPRLVALRDYQYKSALIKAISDGFPSSPRQPVPARILFEVGLSIGVIEQNPRDPDEYRILSPNTDKQNG